MRVRRSVVALLLLASCKRAAHEGVAKPVPIEESPKELADPEIGTIACAARPKCKLEKVWRAGLSGGAMLAVAQVALDDEKDAEIGTDSCIPYEHWLVKQKGKTVERKLLLEVCNDGYGASHVGEDVYDVSPNVFEHVQSGGSASRWEHTSVLELSPMRLRSIGWWYGWSIATAFERGTFDFVDFKGHVRWYRPECPEDGSPPEGDPEIDDSTDNADLFVYDPIPIVGKGFDWKTATLDACAPPFDGTSQGYVIHGAKSDPKDSGLRVLATDPKTLVVEVIDDVSITGSPKWLFDDHLELWVEDEPVDPADLCIPGRAGGGAGRLRQWAIRVSDGKLFPGYGAPTLGRDPIVVEHAGNRFRIELKMPVDRVSVVFSDGDDGKSQERLVSTSRLVFGKAPTLGRTWQVPESEVVCEEHDGKLVRVPKRSFDGPGAALADVP